jgi:hypothetical protein
MKALAIFSTSILIASAALAQEPQMPDMKPPKEMEKFHSMVGTWMGEEKHFEPGAPQPIEVTSTTVYRLVLGGHFLQGDYKTSIPGMGDFSGMQMLSYDPQSKSYQMVWFDSMSNMGLKGASSASGPEYVFVSEEVDMPGMGKTRMRITTMVKSSTMYTMKIEMQMGGTWTKFMEGEYTKQ